MNNHAKVVQLIFENEGKIDYREICMKIAIKNPKIFLDAATSNEVEPYVYECIELMREGRKIPAIKHWRAHTGAGLLESKKAVESLILT